MRFTNYLPAGCLLLAIATSPARADSCQDLREFGDTLRWAIPVTALGVTALKRDKQGAVQFGKTALLTGAGTGFFKYVGDKTRPDARTSRESFVSGHVSGATMGAAFMYTRYGKAWGIPAYALAALTAIRDIRENTRVLGGISRDLQDIKSAMGQQQVDGLPAARTRATPGQAGAPGSADRGNAAD